MSNSGVETLLLCFGVMLWSVSRLLFVRELDLIWCLIAMRLNLARGVAGVGVTTVAGFVLTG